MLVERSERPARYLTAARSSASAALTFLRAAMNPAGVLGVAQVCGIDGVDEGVDGVLPGVQRIGKAALHGLLGR